MPDDLDRGELFQVVDGRREDAALWQVILGDDILPGDKDYAEAGTEFFGSPDQPRYPKGDHQGGRWRAKDEVGAGSVSDPDVATTREYLKTVAEMMGAHKPDSLAYAGQDDFIYQHGRGFDREPLPTDVKKGKLGECYKNAFGVATSRPAEYTYVEGKVLVHGVPIDHAWVVNKSGRAVDPTVGNATYVTGYFGVPFHLKQVMATANSRRKYGIIDNPDESFPLITGKVKYQPPDTVEEHYDPAQPREPAGGSGGGQWTTGTGGDIGLAAHDEWRGVPSDAHFVYHATNLDNALDIGAAGFVKPHRPSFGTDQATWPDGSMERRSYFTSEPAVAWQFAPADGTPVLLRVPRAIASFQTETTGDIFAREKVPVGEAEFLDDSLAWRPLSKLSEVRFHYDPNQPRQPGGTHGGGRWVSKGDAQRQNWAGTNEDELPYRARTPGVSWALKDMQDSVKRVDEASVLRDYGDPRAATIPVVYQAYFELADLDESLIEEGDPDFMGYDWSEFNRRGTFPAIKVEIRGDGPAETPVVIDGNHRVRFWKEADFEYAPAWVLDYRVASGAKMREPKVAAQYDPTQPRHPTGTKEGGRWVGVGGRGPLFPDGDGKWSARDGKRVRGRLARRIKELRVPPGWRQVEINPDGKAALQAVGIDIKGRPQYLYSAEHSAAAAAEKFARLKDFNRELPTIRRRVEADLTNPNLDDETRDSALVLRVIDQTGFRVGSDRETLGDKKAFGASTLLSRHVRISGDDVTFAFPGKHGVANAKTVTDPYLARLLKPKVAAGGRLFSVSDGQVRGYLHSRDGVFKVKDFRTWHGTAKALSLIKSVAAPDTQTAYKRARAGVAKAVAAHLGNTPAVALSSYIDPAVWGKWEKARWRALVEWRAEEFYDPTQPREPAGTSKGGQFAPEGGGRGLPVGGIIVYHGTWAERLEAIKAGGLRFRGAKRTFRERGLYTGERGESIYVTRRRKDAVRWTEAIAASLSRRGVVSKPKMIVLKVVIPTGKAINLVDDEEADEAKRFVGTIPPEWIVGVMDVHTGKQSQFVESTARTFYVVFLIQEPGEEPDDEPEPEPREHFDPTQPRAPSGSPEGGQWSPAGGGASGAVELPAELQRDMTQAPAKSLAQEGVDDVDDLYAQARKAEPEFVSLVEAYARNTKGKAVFTPPDAAEPGTTLKSRTSAERKIRDEYHGDPSRVTDIVRGTVEFATVADLRKAAKLFIDDNGDDIVEVKDRFAKPVPSGYRDMMVKLRMSNGHIAELQFGVEPISVIKFGEGHRLYEQERAIAGRAQAGGRMMTKMEWLAVASLVASQTGMYTKAFQAAGDGMFGG